VTAPASGPAPAPAPAPPERPAPRYDPPRRLEPSPERDRPWRRGIVLAGGAVMLLVLLALAAATTATWWNGRHFAEIPATTGLGTPSALHLTSTLGDVRVQMSPDVEEITLSLVSPGTTVPAPDGEQVRARLERSDDAGASTLRVSQPENYSTWPGTSGTRDVLLLIPTDHELDLDLDSEVGDVTAEGAFGSLDVQADVGDVHLGPVSAPQGLGVLTDVGDIEAELEAPGPAAVDLCSSLGNITLQLPADASGPVGAETELGDVDVAVAGTSTWRIETSAGLGEVSVDPGLRGDDAEAAGTLTLASETGDITLTR
jgi:hypothetical protein